MALNIRKSDPNLPVKMVICGPPGIGKTTLGAKSDRPIFLSLEGGAERVTDVNENPVSIIDIKTLGDLKTSLSDLKNEKHSFGTIVIDSADWLEKIVHAHIIGDTGKSIITVNKGYGAGLSESTKIHSELVKSITEISLLRKMNVIVTAHVDVKAAKDPSVLDDYDYFEMKCNKEVSSLWREWSDAFLFARKPIVTKNSDDTTRARALIETKPIVYTQETAFFKAKNRYGLPPEMPFTLSFWGDFNKVRKPLTDKKPETIEEVAKELNERWMKITDETLKATVKKTVTDAQDDIAKLTQIRNRLREMQGAA